MLASLYFLQGNSQRAYATQKVALLEARAESDELKSRYAARLVYFAVPAVSAVQLAPDVASNEAECIEVTTAVGALAMPAAVVIAMQPSNGRSASERGVRGTVLSSERGKPCNAKPLHIRIAPSDWQRTQQLFRRENSRRLLHMSRATRALHTPITHATFRTSLTDANRRPRSNGHFNQTE